MKKLYFYLKLFLLIGFITTNLTACSSSEPIDTQPKIATETMTKDEEIAKENTNILNGPYKVKRVIDGDTIVVNMKGKDETVRFILIDTPESAHPEEAHNIEEGRIASEYTTNLLEGKSVSLEFDMQERDEYDRLLAYVYLDDMLVNEHLLEVGYAQITSYPPNIKHKEDFEVAETKAKDERKGFWPTLWSEHYRYY